MKKRICSITGHPVGSAWLCIATILLTAACQPESERSAPQLLTAAELGEQTITAVADIRNAAPYATADLKRGERLAMQCRACHSFDAGGPQLLGPNLAGVFNRAAGSVAGFPYSGAMLDADIIWTARAMDAFLTQPFVFLPGTQMAYVGMPVATDRNALILFLLHETDIQSRVMESSE
ncbi:MAG: cytochrome c family protein [Gammaproteobacteria bacterium]|nr:cytochrome c family protein [Gammaproteobacteria bacterium]